MPTTSFGLIDVWMKINPENFIANNALCLSYKSFFISGNDEGYIFALMGLLVRCFLNNGFIKKTLAGDDSGYPDLFKLQSKYVYVCETYIGNNSVEEIEKNKDILIFYEKTSKRSWKNQRTSFRISLQRL